MEWMSKKAEEMHRNPWLQWRCHRQPRRAIHKNGDKNVIRSKLAKISKWRYLQDIFTTLMDAQWRWTVQFIAVEFFGCWLLFALIWWLIAFVHGDLQEEHLPLHQPETGWTPCVLNIYGFHSCFLYSLETQHTTGYGLRVITEECPEAIFILCFQCIIGMIIDSFTIGIVFAKLARAKFATYTIQFSKNAVMSYQDGKLCFMFRVGDIRRSRLVGVGVRAIIIKTEHTKEGEVLSNYQTELSLKADGGDSSLFLLWPLIIYHEIDENSPLCDFSIPQKLKNQKIEIVVTLNATVESTGASIETRSSYLASEILWGHKFESVVSFNKNVDCFEIDWSKFDKIVSVNPTGTIEAGGYENESDTQETMLINDHDPKRFFSSINQEVPIRSYHSINQDAMINFDDIDNYLPSYKKPSPPTPVWQVNQRIDLNQSIKSRYDSIPETTNETDESQEMRITYV